MNRPEDISAEAWDAANEADQKCQKESCKDIGCNGFLCANALRAALLKAREEAFVEVEKLIVKDIDYHNRRDDPEHQAVGAWIDPFKAVDAIRQHSQKGER